MKFRKWVKLLGITEISKMGKITRNYLKFQNWGQIIIIIEISKMGKISSN